MLLLDLPLETLSAIIYNLGNGKNDNGVTVRVVQTLRDVRLVCKALSAPATRRLFATAHLLPGIESVQKWESLLADTKLSALVRGVIIDTFPDKNWTSENGDPDLGEFEAPEEWEEAIGRLPELPGLEGVHLRFSQDCAVDQPGRWWGKEVPETTARRQEILELVFKAMADANANAVAAGEGSRRVRSLTIQHLQNVVQDELVESEDFKSVLAGLEELHVSVCTEYDDAAPECSLEKAEVRTFWPRFTQKWLQPLAPRLRALSIYGDTLWGVIPTWDSRALHFPKLKSLALGNYTLAYDWQVDWLAKHETLQSLSLDDCPIAHYFRVDDAYAKRDLETNDLIDLGRGGGGRVQKWGNSLRWDFVFSRLQSSLPALVDFRPGHGAWEEVR